MLGALTHAVVHMVAIRCNDPVIPLDILELDVEFSLAAHTYIVTAMQRALPDRVLGVVLPKTHLGHQEGLVAGVGGAMKGAKVLSTLNAADFQMQSVLAPIQECLQGAGDGESVPVTRLDLQHLFHHQGSVRAGPPTFCREKDPSRKARVSIAVLRGADVDPQRRVEHLDTVATFLQKLEGKTEAGCIATLCLIYGSMTF